MSVPIWGGRQLVGVLFVYMLHKIKFLIKNIYYIIWIGFLRYYCPVPGGPFLQAVTAGLPGLIESPDATCFGHCASVRETRSGPLSFRGAAICHDPVQHPDESLSRDIQGDFYRQCFTVKIIHHIKGPEASAADQRVVHKIAGPAMG